MPPSDEYPFVAIAAMASNRVIGRDGQLAWEPEDAPGELDWFREKTNGHVIIMGRTTYESIGRLLPGRESVILTRNPKYEVRGASIVHQLDKVTLARFPGKTLFIIGGEQVYRAALPSCHRVLLTTLHQSFPGDAYFPEFERDFLPPTELRKTSQYTIWQYDRLP